MRVPARGAIAVLVVAVLATGVVFGPGALRRVAFFRVRQVEVMGARYLDEVEVARRLGLRSDASTFDRLAGVRVAAAAIPGVLSVSVERRLPGTLRVTIREATPVALADQADRLVLIDSNGRALPFDPTRVPASLPIAVKDAAVATLLARMMRTDLSLYGSIDAARLDRGDVLLEIGARHIRLRPQADAAVLYAVSAVMTYLNKSAIAWREIDARYHRRVFVQKGTA